VTVPSFVLYSGLTVRVGSRHLHGDVAFGGAFYAIVDAESAGVPLDPPQLSELRRMGMEISKAIEALHPVSCLARHWAPARRSTDSRPP